jgi:hydrogenase nickel incorporation protein HypB
MAPQYQTRFDLNSQIARANRASLDAAGVTAISLVGPAGSGKTSLIEALLSRLDAKLRTAAIVADLAAERQVERIVRHGCKAIPIVTDNLAAINVRDSLAKFNLNELDLLLIESEGNAHSPVEFDLGHHVRASVFSVAGGDDKATEYPFLIAGSDLVLVTKVDLLPLVKFDFKVFAQDVARVKPKLPIIQLSMQSNQGITQWVEWVTGSLARNGRSRTAPRGVDPFIRIPNQ